MSQALCQDCVAVDVLLRTSPPASFGRRRFSTWLRGAWQRWLAYREVQAYESALCGLSDQTLRDIGMAERVSHHRTTLGMLDYERGRWQ